MRATLLAASVLVVAGCATLEDQQDLATFHAEGAFEAAVAADGRLHEAAEDLDDPGRTRPTLPFAAADLDAAWGADRYRLQSIHWWGPGQAPSLRADDNGTAMTVVSTSDWQGFLLMPDHLQVLPGDAPHREVSRLAEQFLANTTTLDPPGRSALIDDLLRDCDFACTTPVDESLVDGGKAWRSAGGLTQRTGDAMAPSGRIALGDWWFELAVDAVALRHEAGEGTTLATVGANDVVAFEWRSTRQHGDDASRERMQEALAAWGLPEPIGPITWEHREIESD